MHDPLCEIRRPRPEDWPRMLEVLETANFHRIGGPEMPQFPLSDCFVAFINGVLVGVGGYRVLTPTTAKTTLLAVDPKYRRHGVGALLQQARMDHLRSLGIKELYTNSDDPKVIAWYERLFGYKCTGKTVPKEESFGRTDVDEWTTLRAEL